MKKALLLGCGSKWGASFRKKLIEQNYFCISVSGQEEKPAEFLKPIRVDWKHLNTGDAERISDQVETGLDLILFAQNSQGAPYNLSWGPGGHLMEKPVWDQGIFSDVQFPYYLIKKLKDRISAKTKIIWMTSGLVQNPNPKTFEHSGYSMNKAAAVHVMQGFSYGFGTGIFMALNPGHLTPDNYQSDNEILFRLIENAGPEQNGKILRKD